MIDIDEFNRMKAEIVKALLEGSFYEPDRVITSPTVIRLVMDPTKAYPLWMGYGFLIVLAILFFLLSGV